MRIEDEKFQDMMFKVCIALTVLGCALVGALGG
jgi:hypothetical protein